LADGDIALGNVRVELYDNSGNFISSTSTDAAGQYTFSAIDDDTYYVRVVNGTVGSNRGSNSTGETIIPVQTYRTNGIAAFVNEVGGAGPNLVDANSNTTNTNLSTLTNSTTAAQSVAVITIICSDVLTVDFGYNFDAVVNVNNAGQGSLRQFILNSNELDNTNLDQEDTPTSKLIRDEKTHISGYTQGGSSPGTISARTINIELDGNVVNFDAFSIFSDNIHISGLDIHSFRKATIRKWKKGNSYSRCSK